MMKISRLSRKKQPNERGYIMLMLMLMVALMAIAWTGTIGARSIAFQIRRDREEELIHRGVQYSRAVRHYYRKFGRYPNSLEELQSSNNMRFLRRAYKDPITGQDFRLLHFGEVRMSFGPGLAGAKPVGAANSDKNSNSSSNDAGLLGSSPQPKKSDNGDATPDNSNGASNQDASTDNNSPGTGQVFGGGPIVGVVSTSKNKGIREFNGKDHYNQWQFIYDPNTDRGGLLSTPNQPTLQATPGNGQGFGTPSTSGQQNSSGIPGFSNQPSPSQPRQQ
jgi:hypothetical protein